MDVDTSVGFNPPGPTTSERCRAAWSVACQRCAGSQHLGGGAMKILKKLGTDDHGFASVTPSVAPREALK
jgi:hypothetical protein